MKYNYLVDIRHMATTDPPFSSHCLDGNELGE